MSQHLATSSTVVIEYWPVLLASLTFVATNTQNWIKDNCDHGTCNWNREIGLVLELCSNSFRART